MARSLDIPPPVKEENKAEYMSESAKLRDAEAWVAKHSVTNLVTEENGSVSGPQPVETTQEQLGKIPPQLVTVTFIGLLIFYIIYIPVEQTMHLLFIFGSLFIIGIISYQFMKKTDVATTQHITVKAPQNTGNTPMQIFTLGFSIPCLIWISLFAILGEPCSVFCSGKEQWGVYEVIFANLYFCGGIFLIALFDAIGNKRFRSFIFLIGFASGSFIGLSSGELFI